MAKRPSKLEKLQAELAALGRSIAEDLQLPSLADNRMEGFAALFVMVLPLLNSEGRPIFTDLLLQELFLVFDNRFGGCLVPSASTRPPLWGLWHPKGSPAKEAEKDYVTTIQIFANPIEPTNRFFARLKQILKTAGDIEQQVVGGYCVDFWLAARPAHAVFATLDFWVTVECWPRSKRRCPAGSTPRPSYRHPRPPAPWRATPPM